MMRQVNFDGAKLLLVFILWFSIINETNSQQSTDNLDLSFGIKASDPVHIKVEEKTGSAFSTPIRFTALNSTYYPFQLIIDFSIFENLSPKPSPREISISHGTNNLFSLSIHVPGQGYNYRYSYGYWLSPSNAIINEKYPYLIPLKEGKLAIAKRSSSGKIYDSFTGNKGDTVYCMRRGLVTAVPRAENLDFRISRHDCLEILHDDGTYMVYHFLNKEVKFTAPGKIVLPGQPIGVLSDSLYLMITLFKVSETKNQLVSLPLTYTVGKSETVSLNDIDGKEKSVHPREVIIKEMKGNEIKKSEKK
jgi:hypothetical protein